jgi:hypothetical protein
VTTPYRELEPDGGFFRGLAFAIPLAILLWAVLIALDVLIAYVLATRWAQ